MLLHSLKIARKRERVEIIIEQRQDERDGEERQNEERERDGDRPQEVGAGFFVGRDKLVELAFDGYQFRLDAQRLFLRRHEVSIRPALRARQSDRRIEDGGADKRHDGRKEARVRMMALGDEVGGADVEEKSGKKRQK